MTSQSGVIIRWCVCKTGHPSNHSLKNERIYCRIILQVPYCLSSISFCGKRDSNRKLHSYLVGFHISHSWTYLTYTKRTYSFVPSMHWETRKVYDWFGKCIWTIHQRSWDNLTFPSPPCRVLILFHSACPLLQDFYV